MVEMKEKTSPCQPATKKNVYVYGTAPENARPVKLMRY